MFNLTGDTGNGEGAITQGATENIFSISNATSKIVGRHNLRFGVQAQWRKFEHVTEVPPRGVFAFNGQFSGNPVADFLLGYCSTCTGAFGSSRSTYRSPTIAPFIDDMWNVSGNLTLQLGLRWEYLAPWEEENGLEGAFDTVSGRIGYHQVPTNLPPQPTRKRPRGSRDAFATASDGELDVVPPLAAGTSERVVAGAPRSSQ